MTKDNRPRGGARPGAGRPNGDRKIPLSVRISEEAMVLLNRLTNNKSAYIDHLIKKSK